MHLLGTVVLTQMGSISFLLSIQYWVIESHSADDNSHATICHSEAFWFGK